MTVPQISRRTLLASATAACLMPASLAARERPADIVRVAEGWLRGTTIGGVRRFLNIPYAASPTGLRRFRAPDAAPSWAGLRDATRFGDAPIQGDPPAALGMTRHQFLGAGTSEDCLKLNIWTPAAPGRHPVFVWIHGGGNAGGAASQEPFDGTSFAQAGIVCVTVGYRVGALGFLELETLLGDRYRGSGVNGLRDQIAALRWVRANIASFGGDPARVTLGGESAGAKNVVALMASPLARGLFTSAIVQSGGETVHRPGEADAVARLFAAACSAEGLTPAALPGIDPAALLAIQARAVASYDRPFPFRAIVGTDVLPIAPIDAFRRGTACDVRLLIGANRDESILFIDRASAARPLAQRDLANRDVADVVPVERRYIAAYPDLDPLRRRVRLLTAEEYGLATLRIAEAHRCCGAGTWLYRFARAAQTGPFAGWASHTAELPFVWGALDGPLARLIGGIPTDEALTLRDDVQRRWHAFIKGANPWPRYDGCAILNIDQVATAGTIDTEEYALWHESASRPDSVARKCQRTAI